MKARWAMLVLLIMVPACSKSYSSTEQAKQDFAALCKRSQENYGGRGISWGHSVSESSSFPLTGKFTIFIPAGMTSLMYEASFTCAGKAWKLESVRAPGWSSSAPGGMQGSLDNMATRGIEDAIKAALDDS